jgi:hypothetical protein
MPARRTVLVLVLAGLLGACREETAAQRVLRDLRQVDILALPDGATLLDRHEVEGGGSDAAAIRGASSITVVYATGMDPAAVARWYHATYRAGWTLRDNGYAPSGGTALGGPRRPDDGTSARIVARPARPGGAGPTGTAAVVSVTVARTRD